MTLAVGDFVILRDTAAGVRRAIKVSSDWRNNSKRNHVLLPLTASGSHVGIGAPLGPHEVSDQVILGLTAANARVAINARNGLTLPGCGEYGGSAPAETDCCYGRKTHEAAVSASSWAVAQTQWAQDIIAWWESLGGVYTEGTGTLINPDQPFRVDDTWTLPCNHKPQDPEDPDPPAKCDCDVQSCYYALVQSCAYWDVTEEKWIGRAVFHLQGDTCNCCPFCGMIPTVLIENSPECVSGVDGYHDLLFVDYDGNRCQWQSVNGKVTLELWDSVTNNVVVHVSDGTNYWLARGNDGPSCFVGEVTGFDYPDGPAWTGGTCSRPHTGRAYITEWN